MARPKKSLLRLLQLLAKKPTSKGKIRRILGIERRQEYNIIKEALKNVWIEENKKLKTYHLTLLGKSAIGIWLESKDSVSFDVYSQVIDPAGLRSEKPKAICTLIMKNAERIKKLDTETSAEYRFIAALPANATRIKNALANVVDSILDIKGKDMRLYAVGNADLAQNILSNIEQHFLGYDSRKRYLELAMTSFKFLIEYNGAKWAKTQRFDDLDNEFDDNLSFYRNLKFHSQDKIVKIGQAMGILSRNPSGEYENVLLFKTKEELEQYVLKIFENFFIEKENLNDMVKKGFEIGLFEYEQKQLYSLKVNEEKVRFLFTRYLNELIPQNRVSKLYHSTYSCLIRPMALLR